MAFDFNTEEERLALAGADEEIYPYLQTYNEARWSNNKKFPARICHGEIFVTRSHCTEQPGMPNLTFNGLKDCHDDLITFEGFWSILWFNEIHQRTDLVYDDGFRSVIVFGKAATELTLRPLEDIPELPTARLFIGPGDVQDCLNAARDVVVEAANRDPAQEIVAVIGKGSAMNPREKPEHLHYMQFPKVPFEWRISRAPKDSLANRIRLWRYNACGGKQNYQRREHEYLTFLNNFGFDDPREDVRHVNVSAGRKRRSGEMAVGPEFNPSSKRRGTGSSQWSSGSQSSVNSPEISRQPSVASSGQPVMGPPPPMSLGQSGMNIHRPTRQTRSRRGSRGSTGSAASRVGSRVAGLTIQSPSWGSPEGVAPPSESSPWGGPPGAPGQFGGGYGPQVRGPGQESPGSGYQGPGHVQQASDQGQLTDVFGHLQYAEPVRPPGPPRVGIVHTQFRGGDWTPPQPGQQQQPPAEQFPAQHSQHPGPRTGFVQWPPGGGGYNVPGPSPKVHGGGCYMPRFPPAEPAMHGRGTHMPQYSRQMIAAPPAPGDDPSMLQGMPMTESPQLHPTAHQFGQGDIASGLPSNVPPMPRSLPPPAMPTIDPSQIQAPRSVPPGGESYPSSVPATTESMRAGLIASPEPEHGPAESESDSDGEDDQFSHQVTSVDQPTLYAGGHDNGRYYHSPMPSGGDQPARRDPYWGGNEYESESSDN